MHMQHSIKRQEHCRTCMEAKRIAAAHPDLMGFNHHVPDHCAGHCMNPEQHPLCTRRKHNAITRRTP